MNCKILTSIIIIAVFSLIFLSNINLGVSQSKIKLQGDITIILTNDAIDFGTLDLRTIDDTTDDVPEPFEVKNEGDVNVDIEVTTTSLFINKPSPTSHFQARCGDQDLTICPPGSVTTWTDIPLEGTTPMIVISNMDFNEPNDVLEIEIRIEVPSDEPHGDKTSTVTITASESG